MGKHAGFIINGNVAVQVTLHVDTGGWKFNAAKLGGFRFEMDLDFAKKTCADNIDVDAIENAHAETAFFARLNIVMILPPGRGDLRDKLHGIEIPVFVHFIFLIKNEQRFFFWRNSTNSHYLNLLR